MLSYIQKFVRKLRPTNEKQSGTSKHTGHLRLRSHPDYLYVVGDIHGRLDLLRSLEELIVEDSKGAGTSEMVFLGDLIDRGPQSAAVLDHLLSPAPAGIKRHALCGNHELMFLSFLNAPQKHLNWLRFGGLETLSSYGISSDQIRTIKASNTKAIQYLDSYIPEEHVSYLSSLPLLIEYPHCVLVHAGLRPGVPLRNQSEEDLTYIRTGFLDSSYDFGKMVIHGHTPVAKVEQHENRINVDTGAFATGCLSAVRISADGTYTFLST